MSCTGPAVNVTGTAATFQAYVFPKGKPTSWWFEYGETASYGRKTATKSVSASGSFVGVAERVTGLSPGTSHHYRICQDNADGLKCANDVSFTTKGPGFQEDVAIAGLKLPTAVRFAPDGRVFVAEKSGLVKLYDSLNDTTPTTFADLRTKVHSFLDRGLLGLALDPDFPERPYVYVAYHHDALPGASAPHYGSPDTDSDECPDASGSCLSDGRVSRLTAAGDRMISEKVLVDDFCFQFQSHSVGALQFGPDGALYASAGDGASFSFVDYGQAGNPCGDPPGPAGTDLTPPDAEGGALRSQDLRTSGDPVGLGGAIIRIHPDTGHAFPGNPLALSPDPNARRIVGYGLRNPFRFTLRPGTNEVWSSEVGWGTWEEINRITDPTTAPVRNFGWPCYEGTAPQAGYAGAGLDICDDLFGAPGEASAPFFKYAHRDHVVPGDPCPTGSSAAGGLAFEPAGVSAFPAKYDGALFFSDYARGCIWAILPGGDGLPDPSRIETFQKATGPVDLLFGPGGDLFYVSITTGTIRRIRYFTGNTPPSAEARANPSFGPAPLDVAFDATGSRDRDEEALRYAWDLDDDGELDDSTDARPGATFTEEGNRRVTLKVTDGSGATDTDTVVVSVGNTPPEVTIEEPSASLAWGVGDELTFAGSAFDTEDGVLAATAFDWELTLNHCDSGASCHDHPLQSFEGVSAGTFLAPDHEYPSYLELEVSVRDSGGLTGTESVRLDPRTVRLTLESEPSGLALTLGFESIPAPFGRTVIQGSSNSVSAPSPQIASDRSWVFDGWSDGGEASHNFVAGADTTLRARFR